MKTRIISAFPGTGKSFYYNENKETCLDSDSSEFSWVKADNGNNTKVRNPDFPQNYIEHIKENIGKYEFIFVSSHAAVREALKANCIHYYLYYPKTYVKNEYLDRYKERGSPQGFIDLLDSKWEEWTKDCAADIIACTNTRMVFDTLSQELDHLVRSENGDSVEEDEPCACGEDNCELS